MIQQISKNNSKYNSKDNSKGLRLTVVILDSEVGFKIRTSGRNKENLEFNTPTYNSITMKSY
jgi:hypothetical protein